MLKHSQAPQPVRGDASAILPVYRRSDIVVARGEGVHLFSPDGTRYLDFAAGIAVNSLGHCHPHVTAALKQQADILWHCSNMYRMPGLERMAERLTAACFADKVFFCNSGGEAVECGFKMIRKYFSVSPLPTPLPCTGEGSASVARAGEGIRKYRIITMQNGFHGRTLACISAGGNEVARKGYEPLVDGFDAVPFNNLSAVEKAIGKETAAILVEPVQGEGGIHVASREFLQGLRKLCDKHGLLLFIDEVQCGMGRTGKLFAYEHAGVTPDVVSVAKGIGNGFPLAACLTTDAIAAAMTPGSHGSTYGSNPLAMAVGNAVLDVMLAPGFFEQVAQTGAQLKAGLQELVVRYPKLLVEVRGTGLMLGLETKVPVMEMVARLRENKLLTAPAQGNVIRITPPLIVEEKHVQEALRIMADVCGAWA